MCSKFCIYRYLYVVTGEKPYICPFDGCNKAYYSRCACVVSYVFTGISLSLSLVTGEKPYICPFDGCNKAYYSRCACVVSYVFTGISLSLSGYR